MSDPISIHEALRFNPVAHFAANCYGKSNSWAEPCMSSLQQIDTNYGAGHHLLIVLSFLFFNDLINWVQYCEDFTENSQQIVTGLISCSAFIYDVSFPFSTCYACHYPTAPVWLILLLDVCNTHVCMWTHTHADSMHLHIHTLQGRFIISKMTFP